MRKHDFGQNLKLQNTCVTIKIRSMPSKSYYSFSPLKKYQYKFDENPSTAAYDTAPKMLILQSLNGGGLEK